MRHPLILSAAVLLGLLSATPTSWSQDAATTQPAEDAGGDEEAATAAGVTPLRFDELTFELGFEATYERRNTSYETFDTRRIRRRTRETQTLRAFEETLGAETRGVLFGDEWVTFDISARWGLSQERHDERGRGWAHSTSPDGNVLEYDLNFTILPRGTLTTNVYAEQLDERVPRAFQPSLERTRERYGVDVLLNDPTFPMRFTIEHVYESLTSNTDRLRDDEQRSHDAFRYSGTWQISEQQALRLEYEYEDRTERYSGTETEFDTRRHYLVLDHTFRFGPDGRSSLNTLARVQAESGDLAQDETELATQLRLQHTDSFATNYKLQYLRQGYFDLETETYRGEVGLSHQLGETLTSTLQLYTLRQNANRNADFTEWGGIGSLQYSQENAYGRLSANVTYNHASISTDDGSERGVVLGESVTFRDPLPAYLQHSDIDLLSIVVTNSTRTRTYLFGRDYLVVPTGFYTSLVRVRSGAIQNNETVLVHYTYRVRDDYDLVRDRLDWRVQHDFTFGLSPYYAGSFQNEDLDHPRLRGWRARDINRHRLGLTYRQPRWSLGAEYEYNDDTIDPYHAVHVNGDIVLYRDARSQLDAQAALSHFWFWGGYDFDSRTTLLIDTGANYRYVLARDLEATAGAMYRYEDDSFYGRTHGVDLTAGVEWQIGYFSLSLEAEYDVLDLPDSDDDSFAVWLKLRREIPVIGRERS